MSKEQQLHLDRGCSSVTGTLREEGENVSARGQGSS